MLEHETYCTNAFGGFDSWAGAVCCKIIPQNQNVPFNTIINSDVTKQLQQDLLNGIKNPLCNDCWVQESRGVQSLRYYSTFRKLRSEGKENYSVSSLINEEVNNKKIRNLVIDSGNMCNLACRTCGPYLSSGHWKETEYRHKLNLTPSNRHIERNTVRRTNVSLLVQEDYSSLEHVQILGGEPFLNLDHLDVLEKIIQDGNSQNCMLTYVSNGTVKLSDKIKNILSNFKRTNMLLSIDATDNQFQYIRTNGHWSTILDNIQDLTSNENKNNNISISINCAVSVLNLLYIEEVYALREKLYCDIALQFVTFPNHYSTNILKDNEKTIIADKLKKSRFDLTPIIQYVNESIYDAKARDQFWKEVKITKEFRGLDINDYLPKLTEILKE